MNTFGCRHGRQRSIQCRSSVLRFIRTHVALVLDRQGRKRTENRSIIALFPISRCVTLASVPTGPLVVLCATVARHRYNRTSPLHAMQFFSQTALGSGSCGDFTSNEGLLRRGHRSLVAARNHAILCSTVPYVTCLIIVWSIAPLGPLLRAQRAKSAFVQAELKKMDAQTGPEARRTTALIQIELWCPYMGMPVQKVLPPSSNWVVRTAFYGYVGVSAFPERPGGACTSKLALVQL